MSDFDQLFEHDPKLLDVGTHNPNLDVLHLS